MKSKLGVQRKEPFWNGERKAWMYMITSSTILAIIIILISGHNHMYWMGG